MKRVLLLGLLLLAALIAASCSDDKGTNPPPAPEPGAFTDSTVFDPATGIYTTIVNGSSTTTPQGFSMDNTLSAATSWDIKFKRTYINLNGGASAEEGGIVKGADLGAVVFDDVVLADTTGLAWAVDTAKLVIDAWYSYNFQTHQLTPTRYVYTMIDAEGDNYIKCRIDSMVGAGMANPGVVWLSYYYNPTANATSLNGTIVNGSVNVTSGTGYFDFSTGTQVTPANPATSTGWDLKIEGYDIKMNGGSNGSGSCMALPFYLTMTDPTDLASVTMQPPSPMFPDFNNSILHGDLTDDTRNWYDYNGTTHQITSKGHVYVIDTGVNVYKLKITGYYGDFGGTPQSGYTTFIWKKL